MLKGLIVDDHSLVQDGLELTLRKLNPEIVAVKSDYRHALQVAADEQPDLVLIDIVSSGSSIAAGLDMLRALHDGNLGMTIIVITAVADREYAFQALAAGARGYVLKSFSDEIILNAIRLILSGARYMPPELFQMPTSQQNPASAIEVSTLRPILTRRQRDVLALLSKGCSNREIAQTLGVVEGTIKVHVAAIFKALRVANRTQAAIAAKRLGLLENCAPDRNPCN